MTKSNIPKPDEHAHSHAPNRFGVLPTETRLDADTHYTARDITIALLDSGFQRHPDLTRPTNRILAVVDANYPDRPIDPNAVPSQWDWHGTQTSVVAAGNGYLSDGVYRGLASEANVVLVRICDEGRISDENIARGIRWVMANRDRYRIDILSISAGGDAAISYTSSIADQAAEEAVNKGIVVVAAAGNSGFSEDHRTMPPANAPSVITVGGYDDNNRLGECIDLYRSSFGPTADGLLKPEIIAPAAWVAAPILVGTEAERRAIALSRMAESPDAMLPGLARELAATAELPAGIESKTPEEIRKAVEDALVANKIVAAHYQHVDGTSFATPTVASVVAQMLDANPDLKPHAVKHILLATADRLPGASLIRQGYGILNARKAVEQARQAPGGMPVENFLPPQRVGDEMVFNFWDASAQKVAIVGNFNDWRPDQTLFERQPNGLWRAKVKFRPGETLRYKFLVDGTRWVEDPNNWLKEQDGDGNLISVLYVSR